MPEEGAEQPDIREQALEAQHEQHNPEALVCQRNAVSASLTGVGFKMSPEHYADPGGNNNGGPNEFQKQLPAAWRTGMRAKSSELYFKKTHAAPGGESETVTEVMNGLWAFGEAYPGQKFLYVDRPCFAALRKRVSPSCTFDQVKIRFEGKEEDLMVRVRPNLAGDAMTILV
jgi:hypothetical protein